MNHNTYSQWLAGKNMKKVDSEFVRPSSYTRHTSRSPSFVWLHFDKMLQDTIHECYFEHSLKVRKSNHVLYIIEAHVVLNIFRNSLKCIIPPFLQIVIPASFVEIFFDTFSILSFCTCVLNKNRWTTQVEQQCFKYNITAHNYFFAYYLWLK